MTEIKKTKTNKFTFKRNFMIVLNSNQYHIVYFSFFPFHLFRKDVEFDIYIQYEKVECENYIKRKKQSFVICIYLKSHCAIHNLFINGFI